MSKNARFVLYGRPGSGSGVCEALLALCKLPYDLIDLDPKLDSDAKQRLSVLNPLAEVPALVLPGGEVMTESAAIAIYLADLTPDAGMSPLPSDPKRAAFLRWMVFLSANNYMTALRIFYPDRYTSDQTGAQSVGAAALARNAFEWSVFAASLGNGPFALGKQMSAIDLYAAMLMSWDEDLDALFARHPSLKVLYHAVAANPEVASVWRRHGFPGL